MGSDARGASQNAGAHASMVGAAAPATKGHGRHSPFQIQNKRPGGHGTAPTRYLFNSFWRPSRLPWQPISA